MDFLSSVFCEVQQNNRVLFFHVCFVFLIWVQGRLWCVYEAKTIVLWGGRLLSPLTLRVWFTTYDDLFTEKGYRLWPSLNLSSILPTPKSSHIVVVATEEALQNTTITTICCTLMREWLRLCDVGVHAKWERELKVSGRASSTTTKNIVWRKL